MKNPELYQKTVDILVQAYFNDKLKHGDCEACAVGNIVCHNMGIDDTENWWPSWNSIFMTESDGDGYFQFNNPYNLSYNDEAKKEIDSTGYHWKQLAKIEWAFESAPKGKSDEDYMFNGLMAVIEALDQIHENTDQEVTKVSQQKFVRV